MNTQFNDSFLSINLPPLYKGTVVNTVPGRSQRQYNGGLRRYIFRHENGVFTYVATQLGQRNGGNNATQPGVRFSIEVPGYTPPGGNHYDKAPGEYTFAYSSPTQYTQGGSSKIVYTGGRWEWQTRADPAPGSPPPPFTLQAYSASTANALVNAGTINNIDWFYIQKNTPITYAATTTITNLSFYNNDSVYKMNLWPIVNKAYSQNAGENTTDPLPDCITQGLLQRCFQGTYLEDYDIVFIEVSWIKIKTYTSLKFARFGRVNSRIGFYQDDLLNGTDSYCWFVPNTVNVPSDKGRVYRIGKLKEYNGNGSTDVVTWAQFTRVQTTRTSRGGNSVFK